MTRGQSPQASVVSRPTASSRSQIAGHVLDPHPVQLDVLPVGDVGGVAGVVARDLADDPQLLGREGAAVDPDAEHEVLVLELVRLERGGLAAVDPGLALGVEAPPAEPAVQVVVADRGEPLLAVDVLDAGAHVERVVLLLEALVGVQRLGLAEGPLALASHLRGAPGTVGPGGVGSAIGHNAKFDMSKGLLMNRCHDPDAGHEPDQISGNEGDSPQGDPAPAPSPAAAPASPYVDSRALASSAALSPA